MIRTISIVASLAALAVALPCHAGEEPKAGLEPGAFRAAFTVRDVTGPHVGTSVCYACEYGRNPTICVFAREVSEPLAELVERLDAELFTNARLRCFVVVLTDEPDAASASLSDLDRSRDLRNVPLTVLAEPDGPADYELDPDAAVTVLMWKDARLKVNRGFASADLTEDQIDAVLAAIPGLLDD